MRGTLSGDVEQCKNSWSSLFDALLDLLTLSKPDMKLTRQHDRLYAEAP